MKTTRDRQNRQVVSQTSDLEVQWVKESVTKGLLVVQALVTAKEKYPLPELVARQGI